jgi:glycosyltransferase involved in cell wall biosynthesis
MSNVPGAAAAKLGRPLSILEISRSGTVGTPDMGPVTKTLCTLANGFVQRGHRVTVADAPRAQARSVLNDAVDVVEIPGPRATARSRLPPRLRGFVSWARSARFMMRLRRQLQLKDFDVIHVHDMQLATLLGMVAPRRCIYTAHSSSWALERDIGKRQGIGRRITALVESSAIRRSRCAIGFGEYLRRQVPNAPVKVIPNGIDPDRWQPVPRAAARAALGLQPEDFLAIFVGRVHPMKGPDVLVEAVRIVAPGLPRLRVVLIGSLSGDFHARDSVSSFAKQTMRTAQGLPIRFTGFLQNDDPQFLNHLSACDVAVIPSRYEPLGYVALEALAMSIPVIASATGGLAEVVTSEVGLLVPPEDPDRLAEALRTLYTQPERLASMREKARARVLEHYTTDRSIDRYLALFEESV